MSEQQTEPAAREDTGSILRQIDQLQQQGYIFWDKGQWPSACQFWRQAWLLIVDLLRGGIFASIEDLDHAYHGRQSISSWAVDYGEAMRKASLADSFFLAAGSEFARQYLAYTSRPDDLNNQNRRRMIAENAFKMGAAAEGDALYQEYLRINPRWGWGWISWAAQYSCYPEAPWYDLARAETLLRKALQVDQLNQRAAVQEKLRDVLIKQGRSIEASALK